MLGGFAFGFLPSFGLFLPVSLLSSPLLPSGAGAPDTLPAGTLADDLAAERRLLRLFLFDPL